MNIRSTIQLYFGGAGSGPNTPCPQCGPKGGKTASKTELRTGDKVRLLKPVGVFRTRGTARIQQGMPPTSRKDLVDKTLPAGKVGRVVSITPRVWDNPAKVLVQFGKKYFAVHVNQEDVAFHKAAGKPLDPGKGIKSKPIPADKGRTVKINPTGRYGVANRTAGEPKDSRGVTDFSKREHPLKGSYDLLDKVTGFSDIPGHEGQNLRTWVYEAKRGDGSGSVVWLHRYSQDSTGRVKQTIIEERNYKNLPEFKDLRNKERLGTPRQFSYKNPAMAFKTLRDRYGIRMKAKDWKYR